MREATDVSEYEDSLEVWILVAIVVTVASVAAGLLALVELFEWINHRSPRWPP